MNAREELARFLHNVYEIQAKIMGWKTQDSCQVEFDKLPEANKRVMLTVAQAVIDVGFVRLSDVEINKGKCVEAMKTVIHAIKLENPKEIDWDWEYANLAHAIAKAKPIRVKK